MHVVGITNEVDYVPSDVGKSKIIITQDRDTDLKKIEKYDNNSTYAISKKLWLISLVGRL